MHSFRKQKSETLPETEESKEPEINFPDREDQGRNIIPEL